MGKKFPSIGSFSNYDRKIFTSGNRFCEIVKKKFNRQRQHVCYFAMASFLIRGKSRPSVPQDWLNSKLCAIKEFLAFQFDTRKIPIISRALCLTAFCKKNLNPKTAAEV